MAGGWLQCALVLVACTLSSVAYVGLFRKVRQKSLVPINNVKILRNQEDFMRHPAKKTGQWWLWLMKISVSKSRLESFTLTRPNIFPPSAEKNGRNVQNFRFPSPADKTGKSVKRSKLSLNDYMFNIINELGPILWTKPAV